MLKIKKIVEKCLNYTMRYESDIVDVWEVAGTKESTEWGGMKQYLPILGLQGLKRLLSNCI